MDVARLQPELCTTLCGTTLCLIIPRASLSVDRLKTRIPEFHLVSCGKMGSRCPADLVTCKREAGKTLSSQWSVPVQLWHCADQLSHSKQRNLDLDLVLLQLHSLDTVRFCPGFCQWLNLEKRGETESVVCRNFAYSHFLHFRLFFFSPGVWLKTRAAFKLPVTKCCSPSDSLHPVSPPLAS